MPTEAAGKNVDLGLVLMMQVHPLVINKNFDMCAIMYVSYVLSVCYLKYGSVSAKMTLRYIYIIAGPKQAALTAWSSLHWVSLKITSKCELFSKGKAFLMRLRYQMH